MKVSISCVVLALTLVLLFSIDAVAGDAGRDLYESEIDNAILQRYGGDVLKVYKGLDGRKPFLETMQAAGIDNGTIKNLFNFLKRQSADINTRSVEHYNRRNLFKAVSQGELALKITEKVVTSEHPVVIKSLNLLAEMYKQNRQFDEAEKKYRRVLEIFEGKYGRKHYTVAATIGNIAKFYTSTGRRRMAEPLYLEALDIYKQVYGTEHASVVTMMYNIALLYDSMGRLSDAEPMYKKAIALAEKVHGKDHPTVASGLNNLGLLYYTSGRYDEVEPYYRRAWEIYEKAYGREHAAVSTALNNLALLFTARGMFGEAEFFYKQAIELDEKLFGPDHANLASDLNNLATLYKGLGRLSEAEPLFKRALEINEKNLGKHPALAANYNNLALVYFLKGQLHKAAPLYRKAIDIGIETLGEDHPDVALWMNNLALLYAAEEKPLASYELFKKTMEIEYNKREDVFTFLPEDQKMDYMKRTEGYVHSYINLTATQLSDNGSATRDTLDTWLRWKGAVMETQQRYMDAVSQSGDYRTKAKFDKLLKVRKKLASMKMSGPRNVGVLKYRQTIKKLDEQKKQLETELSRLSREFALEKTAGRANSVAISSLLPKDSVYIDYANVLTYDFKKRKGGEPRYYVFVLLPGDRPVVKIVDLGETREINMRVNAYLQEVKSPLLFGVLPREDILREESLRLHASLIKPIEKYLQGKKHLFISPGGNLNLIPFEVIVNREGKYLIEDYVINYITAGRDIMRFTDTSEAQKTAVIIADPDYDYRPPTNASGSGKRTKVAEEVMSMSFSSLPDSRQEADEIEKILKGPFKYGVDNYKGKDAREEILYEMKSPRILHLATHGYFLRDVDMKSGDWLMQDASGQGKGGKPADNPMLRSGIVLAGVNTSLKEGSDYGLVSADKAMTLRLRGIELVVLSACDTGVGEVSRGEGVFGLKRAFIVAGAKTLVMSLWSVPSRETTALMIKFYRLMAQGRGKAAALREAKLELMREHSNPFFWGAFVVVGKPD
jgi:CHAT domain-containing protein/tetratricopeptide (TPR) repeat protein